MHNGAKGKVPFPHDSPEPLDIGRRRTRMKILIVEDYGPLRLSIAQRLREEGYAVDDTADGKEGFWFARDNDYAVALLDINLPSMNGMQVTRHLKAELPNTAVIMLTAYHDENQVFHAIRAGASAYYPKDVTAETLLDAIEQVNQGLYVVEESVLSKPDLAKWIQERFDELGAFFDWILKPWDSVGRERIGLRRSRASMMCVPKPELGNEVWKT